MKRINFRSLVVTRQTNDTHITMDFKNGEMPLVPAHGVVLLPHNHRTGVGRGPGCSFIMSVDQTRIAQGYAVKLVTRRAAHGTHCLDPNPRIFGFQISRNTLKHACIL